MPARLSLTGLSPSLVSFPKTVLLNLLDQFRGPNPRMHAPWFGALPFSLAATHRITCCFLFLRLLRCFSSPGSLLTLWIGVRMLEVCSSRFPHSEISGSMGICPSPKLFAAYHVLHRLLVAKASTIRSYQHNQTISSHGMRSYLHIYSVILCWQ